MPTLMLEVNGQKVFEYLNHLKVCDVLTGLREFLAVKLFPQGRGDEEDSAQG